MPQDPRKLICTACQHDNEVERVYCHNCGEKLDRSLLPVADLTKPSEDKVKAAKKVQKMMNPNRFNWWLNFKTFVLVEFLAAIVAIGYLVVQVPAFVQPLSKEKLPELEVSDVWTDMLRQKAMVSVTFKEFDLNYYLSKAMRGSSAKPDNAFVHFEQGLITIGIQRNVLGLSICNIAAFKPARDGVKWKTSGTRFAIGRLTVPEGVAKLIGLNSSTLGAFAQALDKEIQKLDRMEKIEPGEGSITFTTRQQ